MLLAIQKLAANLNKLDEARIVWLAAYGRDLRRERIRGYGSSGALARARNHEGGDGYWEAVSMAIICIDIVEAGANSRQNNIQRL